MTVDQMASTTPATTDSHASRTKNTPTAVALHILTRYPMVWVALALAIAARIAYDGFLDPQNLRNILSQNAPLALIAIGMTFVMITGSFDLSVGSIFAAGAVVFASFDGKLSADLALLIAVAAGAAAGLLNGILITKVNINAFVATLGTAAAITGAATIYSGQQALLIKSMSFGVVGSNLIAGIPIPVWIALVAFVVAGFLLSRTVYGRAVYAVGGNDEAARLSGMRVGLIRASTFVMVGALSGLAGVLLASQIGTAQPDFGASMALDAIAVVIIGGTSLLGGEGSIGRTFTGLLILAIINNLFQSLAFDPALQQMIKGFIVVAAVGLDSWARSRR
ncbi:ABC transporter permease [Dactylosporangium fulvum]|uniref:ABC transporter permease n=1 Tax=Dactylosporangium fulvum TaxID=53359 RepID=A0ABY5W9H2_9ACTN|nr:ABC transporter permease [Dactylosporangium fulvum]UWP85664.1 ABC transporter permease [Dactylosporangium fulvum]